MCPVYVAAILPIIFREIDGAKTVFVRSVGVLSQHLGVAESS